jgi:hypothetical protein
MPVQQAIPITIHIREPRIIPLHQEFVFLPWLAPGRISVGIAISAVEHMRLEREPNCSSDFYGSRLCRGQTARGTESRFLPEGGGHCHERLM